MQTLTHALTHALTQTEARWRAVLAVIALSVLGHWLLLALMPWGAGGSFGSGVRARVQTSMQTRQILRLPTVSTVPAADVPPALTAAAKVVTKRAGSAQSNAPTARDANATAQATPAAKGSAIDAPAAAAEAAEATAAVTTQMPDGGSRSVPTYATKLLPSVVLSYAIKRGGFAGEAELAWRPRDDGYTLSLQGHAGGAPLMAWSSVGAFDEAGIAPERFTDRRRGRSAVAAHFQRQSARITFSGPRIEYPLLVGAQDRLSWWMQLPALVAAAPQSFGVGAQITLFVVGARGDADVWTFDVDAFEDIELPLGKVTQALHLLREPRRPYDTRVEVWLDPARQYLPVRLRLGNAPSGEVNEFALTALSTPP